MKRFTFSLGSDHAGLIYYVAVVYADTAEEAVGLLQMNLPEAGADILDDDGNEGDGAGVQYIRAYFNPDRPTVDDIEDEEEVEEAPERGTASDPSDPSDYRVS